MSICVPRRLDAAPHEDLLTVDFLAMANLYDTDNQIHIGNRIDNPIRSLADAILESDTLLRPHRSEL